jgi:homoserine kinase type II
MNRDSVFLVWHVHQTDGGDDEKLIGVYSTMEDAEAAVRRSRVQPGFRDFPDGFELDEYELNRDHWTEGFVTV